MLARPNVRLPDHAATVPVDSLLEQLQHTLSAAYTIERELGRGGMATVYLARDLKHERRVALTLLDPELGAAMGVERFLAEIRVTANLQHTNVLPLLDSGSADGLLYYVMPYVDGESLRARLDREGPLAIEQALGIVTAVAAALDHAHRHGIVHRDVKPENILLSDGVPVVADFGIAKAVAESQRAGSGTALTQVGSALGTPSYMSPEQAMGEADVDARTGTAVGLGAGLKADGTPGNRAVLLLVSGVVAGLAYYAMMVGLGS